METNKVDTTSNKGSSLGSKELGGETLEPSSYHHMDDSTGEIEASPPCNEEGSTSTKGGCCSWRKFNDVEMAQGYAINGAARGAIVMSNIFLATSFVYLASEAAGCVDSETEDVIENCNGQVYGMAPGALVSNIAVISGVLSALFMPLFGAIMDYTHHRWNVGVASSILMTLIQAAQTFTISSTWFVMAILQAIAGFLYQIEVLAIYAYLPDIGRIVGEKVMTKFQAFFTMIQFSAQVSYLIIIIAISILIGWNSGGTDDVKLARLSQGINVVWITIAFYLSWRKMPQVPPSRQLPENSSLWIAGFAQVGRTAKRLYRDFRKSLWIYLWAVIFAEAGTNAFTVVSVIYLDEKLGLTSSEIGIFFVISLIGTIPGSRIGAYVSSKINPKNSWRLVLLLFVLVTVVGSLFLTKETKIPAYIWGFVIGFMLGWHYPTEGLIFSLCLPKGQDTELAGFYVYCTQILVWLPPLIFSSLVQAGVDQKWGLMVMSSFFIVAAGILTLLPGWDEVLQHVSRFDKDNEKAQLDAMEEGDEIKETAPPFPRVAPMVDFEDDSSEDDPEIAC